MEGDSTAAPDNGEVSSHVDWATKIVDNALQDIAVECAGVPEFGDSPGAADSADGLLVMNKEQVGDRSITEELLQHPGDEHGGVVMHMNEHGEKEAVLTSTSGPRTRAETGKHKCSTSDNFTCIGTQQPEPAAVAGTSASQQGEVQPNQVQPSTPGRGDHPYQGDELLGLDVRTPARSVPVDVGTPSFCTSTPVQAEPGHTQARGVRTPGAGGVDLSTEVDEVFSGNAVPDCHHVRGGRCLVHGKKAVRKFRPRWVTTIGPGGEVSRKYRKQYYWQCDVGLSRVHTMKQTKLSFSRVTPARVQGARDTDGAGGVQFSSTTAGQIGTGGCVQARNDELGDEN